MKEKLDSVQQGKRSISEKVARTKARRQHCCCGRTIRRQKLVGFVGRRIQNEEKIWRGIQPKRGQALSPYGGTNDKLELEDFFVSHRYTQIVLEIYCI